MKLLQLKPPCDRSTSDAHENNLYFSKFYMEAKLITMPLINDLS